MTFAHPPLAQVQYSSVKTYPSSFFLTLANQTSHIVYENLFFLSFFQVLKLKALIILLFYPLVLLQAKHRANDCYKRLVACRYCAKSYVADTLVTHQTKCVRAPIPCPNQCEMVALPREELDVHIKEHCNSLLVSCAFKEAGCRFKVGRAHGCRYEVKW